ncbi:MAG TPA: hypothetical protein VGL89_04135 [Candidatus Koribacter sp.]
MAHPVVEALLGKYGPLPKKINRREHAVLDYLVTAGYLLMAAGYWGRHKRAAFTALVNAGMVLGVTLNTNYEGGINPVFSFKGHGEMDLLQAGTAAFLPFLLGFGHEAAALPFQIQAASELAVVNMTDWERENTAGIEVEGLPERIRRVA